VPSLYNHAANAANGPADFGVCAERRGMVSVQSSNFSRGWVLVGFGFLLVLLLTAVNVGQAQAQEVVPKNIHYFQPPSDGSGIVTTWGSESIGHLGLYFGSMVDYASQPLEWTDPKDATHILIFDHTAVQVMAGFGVFSVLNVSVAMDYAVSRTFNDTYNGKRPFVTDEGDIVLEDLDDGWDSTAMGDMRVAGKYMFRRRHYDGYGLALAAEASLPTGDETQFMSDEQMTITPRAIFDLGNTWWTWGINTGVKIYTEDLKQGWFELKGGNELMLTTGAMFRVLRWLELLGDVQIRTPLEYAFDSDFDYGEGYLAARLNFGVSNPVSVTLGSGFGILDGVGTPIWRGYLGVGWNVQALGLPR
jgi:hypothetical protein